MTPWQCQGCHNIDPILSLFFPHLSSLGLASMVSFCKFYIDCSFLTYFNLLGCIHFRSNRKSRNSFICLKRSFYFTLRAVGFSFAKRERNTASKCLLFHRACASSSRSTWCTWCQFHLSINFSLEVFRYKRIQIYLTKALAKERFICSLWSFFLSSLERDWWTRWTQHSKEQFETIRVLRTFAPIATAHL